MSEFQRRPTDDEISDAIEAAVNALYGDLQSSMGIATGDFASHFDTRDKGHPATARDALRKLAFAYVDAEHALSLQALDPMEREAVDVGTRVVFAIDLDLYPHTVVNVGETGTVVAIGPDIVEVRLDAHHEGLDEWQNVVHLTDEHGAGMGDASGDNPGDAIDGLLHYTRQSDTSEPATPRRYSYAPKHVVGSYVNERGVRVSDDWMVIDDQAKHVLAITKSEADAERLVDALNKTEAQ